MSATFGASIIDMDVNSMPSYVLPLICGIVTILFSWIIIYIDTDETGKSPDNSFSSLSNDYKLQRGNYDHSRATRRIGFILSFGSGVIVFCLLHFVQWENNYLKIY